MYRVLTICFSFFWILSCTHQVAGQAFNPYQHAYQGWDGNKIRKASPIRAFLNKFSLNANLGYGRTFYSHDINSNVLEIAPNTEMPGSGDPKLVILGDYTQNGNTLNYRGLTNWLNFPTLDSGSVTMLPGGPGSILYADSAGIRYGGSGYNIPFNISLHLDLERFRIGGGIMYEYHHIEKLNPREQSNQPYIPNFGGTFMFRYYFTAGAKVYHFMGWDYNVDIQIGKVKYDNKYDKSRLQNGVYFNIGLPFEYELSEYFWVVVRPSFDYKSYSFPLSGSGGETATIQHKQPAFYLNLGVRVKLPDIKKCPVPSCHTQLKHVHGSQEFRGQPFYKKQNPKIGELYQRLPQKKRKYRDKNIAN